ncbi:MAG TPA: ATP-binding protein [Terriglobales bacterium]|nr:ATP-binding protein [Terriglobales bacterium]
MRLPGRTWLDRLLWRPASTRGQLTFQYTVVFSLLLVLAAGLLYFTLNWILFWNIDNELQDEAALVKQYIRFDQGKPVLTSHTQDVDQSYDLNTIFNVSQILNTEGVPVKSSPELTAFGFSFEPKQLKGLVAMQPPPTFTTMGGRRDEEVRFVNTILKGPGGHRYLMQIGTRLKPINDAQDTFLWVMLMLLPVTVVLSAVGGSVMAKRTLKPVTDMTHAAQTISASNLSQRLPTRGRKDELDELAETFNAMIARLQQSFDKMNEFAANVSHELRTPLQAMQGETELALIARAPLAECRRVLESNLEEIDRLNRMIRNLLVLAQADAGEMRPRLEPMDLNELVRDLVEQMRVVAQARGVELRADTSAPVALRADSLRVRQMVLNLIDNAVKYTPAGGRIEVRVDRVAAGTHAQARVQVRDTGVGIAADDLPFIFDRFYRADKSRTRGVAGEDGCGLGLPIVKWVAETHGGSVEVSSLPGQGSSFVVHLPLAGAA